MKPTRICIVRHGETAWNAEGRVQGQLDIPLNDVGRAQARATAEALANHDFTAIYCSDLSRVRQTCEPAARKFALPVTYLPELRERHYGMFETLTYVEVRARMRGEMSVASTRPVGPTRRAMSSVWSPAPAAMSSTLAPASMRAAASIAAVASRSHVWISAVCWFQPSAAASQEWPAGPAGVLAEIDADVGPG